MPNGGSDCCGTCWFNRTNRGERDWLTHADRSLPPYCEIRNLAIEDPFYTYCANHPHRRPDRDPIPIGPVTRYDEGREGTSPSPRYVWKPSPDSVEIRPTPPQFAQLPIRPFGERLLPPGEWLGPDDHLATRRAQRAAGSERSPKDPQARRLGLGQYCEGSLGEDPGSQVSIPNRNARR